MKTVSYYGAANFQEYPHTGRLALWKTGSTETVSEAIADVLLAADRGFTIGGTVRINDACLLGASPDASADTNSKAIQDALDAGGFVTVSKAGTYAINKTLLIRDYTKFVTDAGVTLRLADGSNCNMLRNIYAQNSLGAGRFSVAGGICTVTEHGHTWVPGDKIFIANAKGNNALNGPQTILTVSGNTYTFAVSGGNPTNLVTERIFVSRYFPINGANFTRSGDVVTVSEPGHKRNCGDHVYIANLGGASSFNGIYEIIDSVHGVNWTYACAGVNETATGVAQVLSNTKVDIDVSLDGNEDGNVYDETASYTCMFVNIGNSQWNAHVKYSGARCIAAFNAANIKLPRVICEYGRVCAQFDSFCDNIEVESITGYRMTDDVLAWGVTAQAGPFGQTAPPSGPGNMGTLSVGDIRGDSDTGMLKVYVTTGFDLGTVMVNSIVGKGTAIGADNNVGVSGGTLGELTCRKIDVVPRNTTTITFTGLTANKINLENVTNRQPAGSTKYLLFADADIQELNLRGFADTAYPTGITMLFNGRTIHTVNIEDSRLNAGDGGAAIRLQSTFACTNLVLDNVTFTGPAAAQGYFINSNGGSRPDNIVLKNCHTHHGYGLFVGSASSGTTNVFIDGLRTTGTLGSGINISTNQNSNVYLSNSRFAALNNNVLQVGGSGTHRMEVVNSSAPNEQWALLTYQTPNVSLSGRNIRFNMGANATSPPARLVPQAGDIIWNTNATGTGYYARTAAGAWVATV